jgi:hypothetical protein
MFKQERVARFRAISAASLGLTVALVLTSCAYLDPRASLDPLDGFGPDVYLLGASEQPRDVTDEVCEGRLGCEKAAESKRVRIIRFGSVSAAQNETYALARSGFRSDRFVIEFLDPSISDEQWAKVTSMVDHTASDSPD